MGTGECPVPARARPTALLPGRVPGPAGLSAQRCPQPGAAETGTNLHHPCTLDRSCHQPQGEGTPGARGCQRGAGCWRGGQLGAALGGEGLAMGCWGLPLGAEVLARQAGQWESRWEDSSPWNYANWAPIHPSHIVTTCTTLSTRGEVTHPPCPGLGGAGEGSTGYWGIGGTLGGHWGSVGRGLQATGRDTEGTGRGYRALWGQGGDIGGHWKWLQGAGGPWEPPMALTLSLSPDGLWRSRFCFQLRPFICQY